MEDRRLEITFSNTNGGKIFSTVRLKNVSNFQIGADKYNVHLLINKTIDLVFRLKAKFWCLEFMSSSLVKRANAEWWNDLEATVHLVQQWLAVNSCLPWAFETSKSTSS